MTSTSSSFPVSSISTTYHPVHLAPLSYYSFICAPTPPTAPSFSPLDSGPHQHSSQSQPDLLIHRSYPGEMISLLLGQTWYSSEMPGLWIPRRLTWWTYWIQDDGQTIFSLKVSSVLAGVLFCDDVFSHEQTLVILLISVFCLHCNFINPLQTPIKILTKTDWFQIGEGVRQGYILSPC